MQTDVTARAPQAADSQPDVVMRLRALAPAALAQMYRPDRQMFAFTVRPRGEGVVVEGESLRYTAITAIGLASAGDAAFAGLPAARAISAQLLGAVPRIENLGDAALVAWAAVASGTQETGDTWRRVSDLLDRCRSHPTVDISWALSAASLDSTPAAQVLRARLAATLLTARHPRSSLFAHTTGAQGARSHVACFADQVYPIHALATHASSGGDPSALAAARACARRICDLQGDAGQWWWHYHHGAGRVIEGYPVYAIHQDAMAPMALRALEEAGGGDFSAAIARGLAWLESAPELGGASLIDEPRGMVWRKVARREPRKAVRYMQAAASRLHPGLRVPGTDLLFAPGAIDLEDRPYHWGWFLYAWR